jgi:glutamate 5-kinase
VLKVGSSILAKEGSLAKQRVLELVSFIALLKKSYEVILVTSGAVAAGYTALKLDKSSHISKKVLASVGQPILMSSYKDKFDIYDINTSQILLTEEDFDSRSHIKIFKDIINTSLEHDILPIVNENDISTTPEQLFGDNDQLSAHITDHTNSDLLVILSDIDGYYDMNPKDNPNAKIKKLVNHINKEELEQNRSPTNRFASGGIVTKLKAAKYLMDRGIDMFLCSGFDLAYAKEFLTSGTYSKGTLFTTKIE